MLGIFFVCLESVLVKLEGELVVEVGAVGGSVVFGTGVEVGEVVFQPVELALEVLQVAVLENLEGAIKEGWWVDGGGGLPGTPRGHPPQRRGLLRIRVDAGVTGVVAALHMGATSVSVIVFSSRLLLGASVFRLRRHDGEVAAAGGARSHRPSKGEEQGRRGIGGDGAATRGAFVSVGGEGLEERSWTWLWSYLCVLQTMHSIMWRSITRAQHCQSAASREPS